MKHVKTNVDKLSKLVKAAAFELAEAAAAHDAARWELAMTRTAEAHKTCDAAAVKELEARRKLDAAHEAAAAFVKSVNG